jgi:hypothetical protein
MQASPNIDPASPKRTSCDRVLLLQITKLSPLHGPDFVNCSEPGDSESSETVAQWPEPELWRVAVLSHSTHGVDWPVAQTLAIGSVDVCAMRAQAGQAGQA